MSQTPQKNQVIYSMVGVGKFYDKKPVIKDIYLSYFYGAKIGVLGLNGAGKSTVLRIIAGVDKEYVGETVLSPGYSIGYLEQEPQLDNSKTVREIVEEGVQETVDLLKEFDALTGVPVLINTSFNVKGEPIVETPEDAMRCFLTTGMDHLILHDVLITKNPFHGILSAVFKFISEVAALVRKAMTAEMKD